MHSGGAPEEPASEGGAPDEQRRHTAAADRRAGWVDHLASRRGAELLGRIAQDSELTMKRARVRAAPKE